MKTKEKLKKSLPMRFFSVIVLTAWLVSSFPAVPVLAVGEETNTETTQQQTFPVQPDETAADDGSATSAVQENSGGVSVWQNGEKQDIELQSRQPWDEQNITGSAVPTLKALTAAEFQNKMWRNHSYTVPEDENLYTMSVATGVNSGSSVEYFAIRYTDQNNSKQTKYIFPKSYALKATNDYVRSLEYTEDQMSVPAASELNYHSYLNAMGYQINPPSQSDTALGAWSVEELLFKTESAISKVNSIDVFMSDGSWSVQGLSVSKVTNVHGYGEYGFYSGKYFLALSKQNICRMQGKQGGVTSLNATGDTLICLGGSGSDLYSLVETPDEETASNPFDDLYTFRLDFADTLNGGIESLLRTQSAQFDPASGAICEHLAIEIEYTDKNGWTRNVTMPVLLSVMGQYKMLGDNIRTIGLAQRGDTLAFTACLPDFQRILSYKLYVGSSALNRLQTTGGISGGDNELKTILKNDSIAIAGLSVYEGTCRMSNYEDGSDPVTGEPLVCYSYGFDFLSGAPLQYYTTTRSEGFQINSGTATSVDMVSYKEGDLLIAAETPENFLIRIKTDTVTGSGTTGNLRVSLNYQDYSGNEKSSAFFNAKEEVLNYLGYWPSRTETKSNFCYLYGMKAGNYIEFPVHLEDAASVTNMQLSLEQFAGDMQIAGVSVSVLDGIGKRRIYAQSLKTESALSDYRIVRPLNHTVLPPFPITLKLHVSEGESYSISTGSGTVIPSGEVDFNSMRYSMSYEQTQMDLGFIQHKKTYDVTVKVAGDSSSNNINGDSGSKNQFYFQLQFQNGRSAFVLANQQLYSDGFRSGEDALFTITVNRDYGDVSSIRIIPEDISDDSDVFDKLNIERITVTERSNGGSAMQYVFDSVGWIGIDYREKSEDHSIIGREGRMLKDLARTFKISYQQKVVNLLCEIAAQSWDINYTPFECSLAAELLYLDLDGQPQKVTFDVISRIYDYMKRTPKTLEAAADGSNQSLYNGMGTISDPNTMLRPCHTDRFVLPPLADCKTLKSITFKVLNRSSEEAQWVIGGVWIARIVSDSGMVTLQEIGSGGESEYIRSMKTEPLCQMIADEGVNQDGAVKLPLLVGNTVKQKIQLSESSITWSDNSSWTSAVTRLPQSTNDTLNIYLYPSAGSRTIANINVSAVFQYTLPFSRIMQVKQSTLYSYGSGTENAVFYYTGIPADDMQNLISLGITCRNSDILFHNALVEQVRDGIVIGTYEIPLGDASATLGLKAAPSGSAGPRDRKRQNMMISFSENTKEMTLFGPTEDYTNVNDIAVAFSYTSTLDKGYAEGDKPEYYTPYVYLTDAGINKLMPGMMAEIPFDIPYVSEITGYRIVSFGNIVAEVNSAMIFNYSCSQNAGGESPAGSGDVLDNCFSINEKYFVDNKITPHYTVPGVTGTVGTNTLNPLELKISTAAASAGQESGTNAVVTMNIYYKTSVGQEVFMAFPDIRQYIQSDHKSFVTGETAVIKLFLPDCSELTGFEISTGGEDELAQWSVEKIEWSLGTEAPLSRLVNMVFTSEPQMISVRNVQLMTHVTVNGVYKGSVANNLMGIMAEGGQPVEITTIVNRGEGFSYKVIWVVNDVQTDVTEQMTVPAEEGFIFTPYLNESTVADIYKIVISANDNPNIQDIITVTVPAGGSKVQAQTPAETPQQVNAQTQPSTVPADYTTTP